MSFFRRLGMVVVCVGMALLAVPELPSAGTVYSTGGGPSGGNCSITLTGTMPSTSVVMTFTCTVTMPANVREIGVRAVYGGNNYEAELCNASNCNSTNWPTGSDTLSATVNFANGNPACDTSGTPPTGYSKSGLSGLVTVRLANIEPSSHGNSTCPYNPAGVPVSGIYFMSASEENGAENVYDVNAGQSEAVTTLTVNGVTTSGIVSPCSLLSIQGDTTDTTAVQNGTTIHDYTITFEGTVAGILADDTTLDVAQALAGTPTRPTVNGTKYATDASFIDASGEWDPSGTPLPTATATSDNDAIPIINVVTLPVEFASGSTLNPGFYCWTGSAWVSWGQIGSLGDTGVPYIGQTPVPGPVQVGSNPSDFCSFNQWVQNSHMSLTDPFSWVSGGLVMMQGMVECVFVPSSSSVNRLGDAFGVGSNAPTVGASSASQWLGAGASLLSSGPYTAMQSIQTAERAGGCSLLDGSGYVIGTQHFSVCTALSAVSSNSKDSSAWSSIKAIVSAALLVMLFLALLAMLRRLLGGHT